MTSSLLACGTLEILSFIKALRVIHDSTVVCCNILEASIVNSQQTPNAEATAYQRHVALALIRRCLTTPVYWANADQDHTASTELSDLC